MDDDEESLARRRSGLAPRVLRPATSRLEPFPRRVALAGGAAWILAVVSGAGGAQGIAIAIGSVCVVWLTAWLEQRLYRRLLDRGRAARVLISLAIPLAVLLVGVLLTVGGGLLGVALRDEAFLGAMFALATLWFTSAAVGTAAVVVIDTLISTVVSDFRSRIQLAVLCLASLAAVVVAGLIVGGRYLAETLAQSPDDLGVAIDLGDRGVVQVGQVLEQDVAAEMVAGGMVLLVILLAVPAILSACGKLADAVMERLNPLSEAIDAVREGDLSVRVAVGGSRDFVQITEGFNRMVASLEETLFDLDQRNQDLLEMQRAAERFVPFQFLELLHKRSLRDIARGDQTQLDLAVMFCDIRGFTTTAEAIGPRATFAFINRYLATMEPLIHRHDGVINEYLGDGIMALFGRPDDAVRAAVAMQRALAGLNQQLAGEGQEPIRVGIGIHQGMLMLGTIGGERRLSCTVVGDPANTAARLEGMTKLYRARVLVSEAVAEDLQGDFTLREVDRVVAKGKTAPLVIHEVLDADEDGVRAHKQARADDFSAGLLAYREGRFGIAERAFDGLGDDGVATVYAERCRSLLAAPPRSWDGITRLDVK